MVSAITVRTKKGVLIKGGEYVEGINKVKAILFDKTGTLTEGNLEISEIIPITEQPQKTQITKIELMKIATSLESQSKHPIASAFRKYCEEKKIELKTVQKLNLLQKMG